MRTASGWVAVGVIFGVAAASGHGFNARSYVQRGLVACYDGIENVGINQHDSDSEIWKDLTGNGHDGEVNENVLWNPNGLLNGAPGHPVTVESTGLSAVTATRRFTLEFACVPERQTDRESFFSQYGTPCAFMVEHNSSTRKTGCIRLYGDRAMPDGTAMDFLSPTIFRSNEFATVTVTVTPQLQLVWKNGELSAATVNKIAKLADGCKSVIGGEPSRPSQAFFGVFHAFRLYDRVLTEDEIVVNAAIDAIRFKGASISDFQLSDDAMRLLKSREQGDGR
ncbi:MAG: hypothetical protein IKR48_12725 [Kiritimatiellae bacterium]|nr:hypothetical protein [Kiritimatiellia bacterium]